MGPEWQQVFWGLQDSSQYLGRSQQYYALMVWICPQISKPSRALSKPLGSVFSASLSVGITVQFIEHSYLPSKVEYYNYFLWVFPTSVNWWSFIGVWAVGNLFKLQDCFQYYEQPQQECNVNWVSFTGVWVAASLLMSSGFFPVFWSLSAMLKS